MLSTHEAFAGARDLLNLLVLGSLEDQDSDATEQQRVITQTSTPGAAAAVQGKTRVVSLRVISAIFCGMEWQHTLSAPQLLISVLEVRAPPTSRRDTKDLDSGTEHRTKPLEKAPQAAVRVKESTEAPQPILAASFSSLDEVIVRPGISPPQDYHMAYQDLLKQVALNLGVQVEVVMETTQSPEHFVTGGAL